VQRALGSLVGCAIVLGACGRIDYRAGDAAPAIDAPPVAPECTPASDGALCPGGVCVGGACCGGCISDLGCEPGDVEGACGVGGASCAVCSAALPVCGANGRCRVSHPIVEAAIGWEHQCARDAEGRVYCWGSDYAGQVGARDPGGACRVAAPILVPLPAAARSISASAHGTCAVLIDDRAYCWGAGHAGGGTISAPSTCLDADMMTITRRSPISIDPVAVGPAGAPLTWIDVASGREFGVGLDRAGSPFFWGDFLFDDIDPVAELPVPAAGAVRTFVEIGASYDAVAARTAEGDLYVWGDSWVAPRRFGVAETPRATGVIAFSVGHQHVCWVLADQRIECDGIRGNDAWAPGPTGGQLLPRIDAHPVTSVAITYQTAPAVACWTNTARELWCTLDEGAPMMLGTEREFESIALGVTRFGALDATGRLWTWLHNYPGGAVRVALPL
jgi:hypothetical protein